MAPSQCWLQGMNLRRIVDQFPGKDLRRIDVMNQREGVLGPRLRD